MADERLVYTPLFGHESKFIGSNGFEAKLKLGWIFAAQEPFPGEVFHPPVNLAPKVFKATL